MQDDQFAAAPRRLQIVQFGAVSRELDASDGTIGTRPVSRSYIQAAARQLGITTQDLRADRSHPEAQATGRPAPAHPPVRDQQPTAIRYCAEMGIPRQAGQ